MFIFFFVGHGKLVFEVIGVFIHTINPCTCIWSPVKFPAFLWRMDGRFFFLRHMSSSLLFANFCCDINALQIFSKTPDKILEEPQKII